MAQTDRQTGQTHTHRHGNSLTESAQADSVKTIFFIAIIQALVPHNHVRVLATTQPWPGTSGGSPSRVTLERLPGYPPAATDTAATAAFIVVTAVEAARRNNHIFQDLPLKCT